MNKGKQLQAVLAAISGRRSCNYIGKRCWNRSGTEAGVITGTGFCRLEGCGGTSLSVKWPDGKRTYPCAKGCIVREDGDVQID